MAPYGAKSARQGTQERACARCTGGAAGVNPKLPQGVQEDFVLRTPFPVCQPEPQAVGAVAAIERDDRAATPGRVPRGRPDIRGNEEQPTVQAAGAILHTLRSGLVSQVGSLPDRTGARAHGPHRSAASRTCSRTARTGHARPAAQGDGVPVIRCRTRNCCQHIWHPVVSRAGGVVREPLEQRYCGRRSPPGTVQVVSKQ